MEGVAAPQEIDGISMRVAVAFQDERLELEVDEGRLVGQWHGPTRAVGSDPRRLILDALEGPRDYPPLRQAVVPGDRVVIALDPETPDPRALLAAVRDVMREAGVEAGSITLLAESGLPDSAVPEGIALVIHDPEDRSQIAYLASTAEGRRVYLNRLITDADFVLPVGRLGYDPVLGYRGPWSVLFPGLSDAATRGEFRARASGDLPDPDQPRPLFVESAEVSWLLGSQFHLGVVEGVSGPLEVVAGLEATVRAQGVQALERSWSFEAPGRAELVVAGIGRPGAPTSVSDLAGGLETAARLVRRGGKIVALSRAAGPLGPAVGRLLGVDDPRGGLAALRGHEADPDYPAALRLVRALAWADVYLLSALDADAVDDLSIVGLERPEEARRLVAASESCLVVSQADRTAARAAD